MGKEIGYMEDRLCERTVCHRAACERVVCVWNLFKDVKLRRCLAICDPYNFLYCAGGRRTFWKAWATEGPSSLSCKRTCTKSGQDPCKPVGQDPSPCPAPGRIEVAAGGTGNFRPLICYRCWFIPSMSHVILFILY